MPALAPPEFHLARLDDVGPIAPGQFVRLDPTSGLFVGAALSPSSISNGGGSVSVDAAGNASASTDFSARRDVIAARFAQAAYLRSDNWVDANNGTYLIRFFGSYLQLGTTTLPLYTATQFGVGVLSTAAMLTISNYTPAQPVQILQGAAGQTAPLLSLRSSAGTQIGSWNADGSLTQAAPPAAPADAALGVGQISAWMDEANSLLKFRCRLSNGTYKTASVALS